MPNRALRFAASFLLGLMCPALVCAQSAATRPHATIHVAAAADLQPVMPLLAAGFEKQTGIHIAVSYGSSSSLAAQITNGAPIDVFFSADYSYAERIVAANLTDRPEPVVYAIGVLVLWERKDGPFQPLTLDALSSPALKSIAVTNPITAPYGMSAMQAMRHMQLYNKVSPHMVLAENVAQAAEYASTGNTQLAFISLTLAKSPKLAQLGNYIPIPSNGYPEIRQCAVVMRNSTHHAEGRSFLDYVLSGPVQAQLPNYGLNPHP